MATSVVTITVREDWFAGRQVVVGTIGLAAGDYPAGGIPITWRNFDIKSDRAPSWVSFVGKAGFTYVWDRAAGKLRIFSGATESTTTTPAGVVSDVIDFKAEFQQLL